MEEAEDMVSRKNSSQPSRTKTCCMGCLKFTIAFSVGAICGFGGFYLYDMLKPPPTPPPPTNSCQPPLYRGLFQKFAELSSDENKLSELSFNIPENNDFLSNKVEFKFDGIDSTLYYNVGPKGDIEFVQYSYFTDVPADQILDAFKIVDLRNKWKNPDVERIVLQEGGAIVNPANTPGAVSEVTKVYPGTIEDPNIMTYTKALPIGEPASYVDSTASYKFNHNNEVIYVTCARGAGGMSEVLHSQSKTPGTRRLFKDDFCQVVKPVGQGSLVFYYYWEETSIPGFAIGMVTDAMGKGLPKVRKAALEHVVTHEPLFESAEIDILSADWSDDTTNVEYEECLKAVPGEPEPLSAYSVFVESLRNATGDEPFIPIRDPSSPSDETDSDDLMDLGSELKLLYEIQPNSKVEKDDNLENENGLEVIENSGADSDADSGLEEETGSTE